MHKLTFCPECSIGLSNTEVRQGFCLNCRTDIKDQLTVTPDDDAGIIRALSWYQPFGSMMLHGKLETRRYNTNVRGPVLICTCAKPYSRQILHEISSTPQLNAMSHKLLGEPTASLGGYAIAIADLVDSRPMVKEDELLSFVKYNSELFIWEFQNVHRIHPFLIRGKQGWKILDDETKAKIKFPQSFDTLGLADAWQSFTKNIDHEHTK